VKELSKRLQRDPSVISRLYAAYAAARNDKIEKSLLKGDRLNFRWKDGASVAQLAQPLSLRAVASSIFSSASALSEASAWGASC
jgi:hypothetical protein